jgi:hypothetical protein
VHEFDMGGEPCGRRELDPAQQIGGRLAVLAITIRGAPRGYQLEARGRGQALGREIGGAPTKQVSSESTCRPSRRISRTTFATPSVQVTDGGSSPPRKWPKKRWYE